MLNKIREFREYINTHRDKRLLGIALVLLIMVILPVIVISAQLPQQYRQHASEPIAAPFPDGDTYQSIDVGSLGGGGTEITDINDKKQVVGKSKIVNGGYEHAFLWENGSIKDLGTLGGCCSRATGINNKGQVVGTAVTGSGQGHAFLYENGVIKDLGVLGKDNSVAEDINDNGQIVGSSTFSNSSIFSHAFLYENGIMKDLGTLGGVGSFALKINNKSQIVGFSNLSGSAQHAFLYEGNTIKDLGALGDNGNSSFAFSINDNSQIVGYSCLTPSCGPNSHAFLYENGVIKDLGTLGGSTSSANDINNVGEIIGYAVDSTNVNNVVIWKNNQPQKPQYGNLTYPLSINNNGHYAANSVFVIKNSSPNPTTPTPTPTIITSTPIPTPISGDPNKGNRVFVTSSNFNGDLKSAGSKFGLGIAANGLDGADKICQGTANIAKLGGTWKAWLSTFKIPASSRLNHSNGPYKLINGSVIADNWDELTRGSGLKKPINISDLGTKIEGLVWTDTDENGKQAEYSDPEAFRRAMDCKEWTSSEANNGTAIGGFGSSSSIDYRWTKISDHYCDFTKALYCFEQSVAVPSIIPSPTPSNLCNACNADIDKNGTVNKIDYDTAVACFGKQAIGSCVSSDTNHSGAVNISDLNCVVKFFGKLCPK